MKDFYKRFVNEELDENGRLLKFELNLKENFNFSYDVIDEIAAAEPDRLAIHWVNENGEEHKFTFKELSEKSSQVANMMLAYGVKKGDMVMAVLKRHYEFWFLAYGLIKLGAILVPATCQLKKKDYIYRFDAAEISYIVATAEDDVPAEVDAALEEYGGMKQKFITHGEANGWINFLEEMEKYPKAFERMETRTEEPMLMYFSSGTTGYPKWYFTGILWPQRILLRLSTGIILMTVRFISQYLKAAGQNVLGEKCSVSLPAEQLPLYMTLTGLYLQMF